MTVTKRRVIEIKGQRVCYEDVDDPQLVIYRTIQEHTAATGTMPKISQIVLFDTWYDYDGSISTYHCGAV